MEAQQGLVIDWTQMPTYNTIMAVAAGAGLLTLVYFARELHQNKDINFDPWAVALGVPGFILTVTGLHMTLTWPFAKYFPFDNIIFGETSLGFGVLLLAASFYLWRRGEHLLLSPDPASSIIATLKPLNAFIIGLGLSLIAIGCAGVSFQLFAAPPEEPITGWFANYPWLEAAGISAVFAAIGVGALLLPLASRAFSPSTPITGLQKTIGWLWGLTGLFLLLFGALNFYTHIGLIVNTMPK